MSKKLGLDQTTAWIIAVVTAGAAFGGGYSLLKHFAKVQGSEHALSSDHHTESDAAEAGHHDGAANEHSGHGPDTAISNGHASTDSHETKDIHDQDAAESKVGGHGASKHEVHWAYEGENGPEMWGKLSPSFVDCQDGRKQSPVNLEQAKVQIDLRPLQFSYQPTEIILENNGHTIGPKLSADNYLTAGGHRFSLVGFHFHAPSEHLVDGVPYEMELHLVHKDDQGRLAVVGIFIEESAKANLALDKIWRELPEQSGDRVPEVTINPKDLLPKDTGYYSYQGSLTTPPCSEGVSWYVIRNAVPASSNQIDKFTRIFRNNARPAQPLHGRTILRSASRS